MAHKLGARTKQYDYQTNRNKTLSSIRYFYRLEVGLGLKRLNTPFARWWNQAKFKNALLI
jgi:hypothetical protein